MITRRLSSSITYSKCQRITASLSRQRLKGYPCGRISAPKTINPFWTEQVHWYSSTAVVSKSTVVEDDVDDDFAVPITPDTKEERTVEEMYSRKTPLEHVLLRPGMYVGAVERLPPNQCWVVNRTFPPPGSISSIDSEELSSNVPMKMIRKDYGIIPALIKVFDEILVNASDNRLRHPDTCSAIDVIIDAGSEDRDPFISIYNDGKGIPIEMHKKENLYVPEMLFGHLLTGSNFDDSEKRVTGGRHGYGAKLTNIFSKTFTVETLDSKRKHCYKQTWNDNMTRMSEPEISKVPAKQKDFTTITFVPDMHKLTGNSKSTIISEEDYAIMCRRVVDVAGCAAGVLRVTLNGQDVSFASFEEYSNLYRHADAPPLQFSSINKRWSVGIGLSENGSFDSVSFVNGMATSRGGTHVNAIVQQVTKHIEKIVHKSHPDLRSAVSQSLIRRNLFVSCNALIENPSFDSQMKESLTSSPDSFGSSCKLSTSYLAKLVKPEEEGGPGIVEEIVRIAQRRVADHLFKEVGGSNKTRRQLLSIPKLEDAHSAGTDNGMDCTLILTEGDSAKALAIAGLEVIGRDHYGVFPLRGKFLNVRDASVLQLANNAEVKALCAILGLDFDKEYDTVADRSGLRYGHVMLMTDQDNDGSHIKGLVVNFFRHFWPKLLKPAVDHPSDRPFLSSFITPLLKATKKGKQQEILSFYSMAEFIQWRAAMSSPDELKVWTIKYYKGLGTSTPSEAKEYFKAFDRHHRPFYWNSELDGELLDMVFDKNRASDRRKWISDEYEEDKTTTPNPDRDNAVTYEDFINNELIHFSNADNIRSLPCVVDGLKPSQRKVLYACFKRKLKAEIKVAQLSGYCAEHTAYHHGEASLQATIIGMAQDYCGSNNINLLVPQGQFGTRLAGGNDAASPRYIFTFLSPVARYLFPEADDVLLTHLEDDGQLIEPEYYCPIIPLLLVNGSQGIGTGWSTYIPPHNPLDVLNYIRAKLDGHTDAQTIRPWARGFIGSIEPKDDGSGYISTGRAKAVSKNSVLIDELPIRQWTNDYKEHLIRMRDKGDITHFVENHTTTSVSFTVKLSSAALQRMQRSGLEKAFKLNASLPTTNMHAFDTAGNIIKFDSAESIADAFFPTRLALYCDRKSVLESEMNYDATMMRNKARFITAVTSGEIDLVSGRKSRDAIVEALHNLGLVTASALKVIRNNNAVAERRRVELTEDEAAGGPEVSPNAEYDYLLSMPLSSLTAERIDALQREARQRDKELDELVDTTPEDLWRQDLDKLAKHL